MTWNVTWEAPEPGRPRALVCTLVTPPVAMAPVGNVQVMSGPML